MIDDSCWRFAQTSVVGTSHLQRGLPCQDASDCRILTSSDGDEVLVAIVSDGAGSAVRGHDGSQLACDLLIAEIEQWLRDGATLGNFTRDFMSSWLVRFQQRVGEESDAHALGRRDYACTVLAAIVGVDAAALFQIGDGVIVWSDQATPDDYCWVFWPQQGEYANSTYFATDPSASERFEYTWLEETVVRIGLLTDGLQPLALHYESRSVHQKFFQPLFLTLERRSSGYSRSVTMALRRLLNSARVNERVDDDKTLLIATRDTMLEATCEN